DIRVRLYPILREELRDLRQQRRIESLIRRIPILGLAPDRYGAIDAEHGQHKLLEVRPLILAIAIGHLEGEVRRLGKLIVAPDTVRSGIKVHIAALQVKPCGSADRTGGKEPHRAEVVEAIEDAPHGIIIKSVWSEGLAQEEFGVLMGEKLF